MTTEQARQHLQAVDEGLTRAVDHLIRTPSNTRELQPELQKLAATLRHVYEHHVSLRPTEDLVSLLRAIQARVARIELLSDRAVTFYCGAVSAALSQRGAYSAEGEMLAGPVNRGHIKLEA